MNEKLLLYDIYDSSKQVLYSQVIIDGNNTFNIPKNYYIKKDSTNLDKRIITIIGGNHSIRLYYEICDEEACKQKVANIIEKKQTIEEFSNYRGQNIIEFEDKSGINIVCFDGDVLLKIDSKCTRYSKEYYILYYIAFSFEINFDDNFKNESYEKNNYCILKNAKHAHDKYKVNLINLNPTKLIDKINRENFCNHSCTCIWECM